jgi:hypothetical protein
VFERENVQRAAHAASNEPALLRWVLALPEHGIFLRAFCPICARLHADDGDEQAYKGVHCEFCTCVECEALPFVASG